MKMTQDRMSPENYMRLHHRTLNRSIDRAKNSNLNSAMEAFSNLNPTGAASALNDTSEEVIQSSMELDSKKILFYGVFLIGVGALSAFLGNWLWKKSGNG